jgi:hypothetical protein
MPPLEIALFGDLGHVVRITATLLGLGIVMAISPTTFGIEIGAVQGSSQARRRVLTIAAAVALSATVLALSQQQLARPAALFAFVAAESLISTTGPATMYLVVHTVSGVRPAAALVAILRTR